MFVSRISSVFPLPLAAAADEADGGGGARRPLPLAVVARGGDGGGTFIDRVCALPGPLKGDVWSGRPASGGA